MMISDFLTVSCYNYSMNAQKSISGITLIELSLVLLIGGLIISMASSVTSIITRTQKEALTQQRLEIIANALYNFYHNYNLLPCPADVTLATTHSHFALAASNATGCINSLGLQVSPHTINMGESLGMVPTRTLALPESITFDAWNNRIRYATMQQFTQQGGLDITANQLLKVNGVSVPFVVFSQGQNSNFAYHKNGLHINTAAPSAAEDSKRELYQASVYSVSGSVEIVGYYQTTFKGLFDDITVIGRWDSMQ